MEVTASKIKVVEGKGPDGNVAHLSLLLSPPPTPNYRDNTKKKKSRKTNIDLENSKENAIFSLLTRLVAYSFYI